MVKKLHLGEIYSKIRACERIDKQEALHLFKNAPWLEVAQLAWECRQRKTDPKTASYTVFRIINYTNICSIACSFCSFKCEQENRNAYVLTKEQIFELINQAIPKGSSQVFFQGGVNPDLPLDYYLDILSGIKTTYGFHIRGFSPVEIKHMAETYQLEIPRLINLLKAAGLDSVPGAGAEILSERVRKVLSPRKCTTSEWIDIMKECHKQGLYGSANIVIGSVETNEEIIDHLDHVRSIQDETGGFNSFIPWTFQAQTKDFPRKNIMHHDYLKLLGISRIYLDNINNIEVSVMVLGTEIGKLALRMGANDISSPVLEEKVLRSFGVSSEEDARKLITAAGFVPVKRDFDYTLQTKKNPNSV
ncbi:CofH family radical SAM protein [bacterium]|nr:CofH family radical SAM protein [bacterium]